MSPRKFMTATLVAAVVLTGYSAAVLAAGNAGSRSIKKVTHQNSNRLYVTGDEKWLNPDVCDNSSEVVLIASKLKSESIYREMFAMIMSAHLSGRTINVQVKDCVSVQGVSYPIVDEVSVR